MIKNYKKRKKVRLNIGNIVGLLAVILLFSSVVIGISSIVQTKVNFDESLTNPSSLNENTISDDNSNETFEANITDLEEEDHTDFNVEDFFKNPISQSSEAEISYFNEVVFLGDTITEGLKLYKKGNPTIVSDMDASVNTIMNKKYDNYDGKTLPEFISDKSFKYIYILFGTSDLNEIEIEDFIKKYDELIILIKATNPESLIYIQSITPVTNAYDSLNEKLSNETIIKANLEIKLLAQKHKLVYLDIHQSLENEDGILNDLDSPHDGVLFSKQCFEKWIAYVRTHTVPKPLEKEILAAQHNI